ncbi:hypothetical protein [Halomarina oriensis]|uniref:Phage protein Gp138 N-terminal domain-containing protein n=1 Tax=Halomarina oriensis TaxID=671145 RepID=A0A6B0GP43_9EURY|nr:hypothetical protein [Halomarina oriensis]MWG36582.1 hypothetical protein [Halomarina oriensis]
MPDFSTELNRRIRTHQRGLYTATFAIVVEEPDPETRRVVVAHQDAPPESGAGDGPGGGVVVDNVPVASYYAGDGYGMTAPIKKWDHGLLLQTKDPIDQFLTTPDFLVDVPKQRQHDIRDAVFMPMVWTDFEAVPATADGHDPEEWLWMHESGTWMRMRPEAKTGAWEVQHAVGHSALVSDTEITLEYENGTALSVLREEILADGDLHVTGDLVVDGSITAGGDITDGQGNTLADVAATAESAQTTADSASTSTTSLSDTQDVQQTTLDDHEQRISDLESGSST